MSSITHNINAVPSTAPVTVPVLERHIDQSVFKYVQKHYFPDHSEIEDYIETLPADSLRKIIEIETPFSQQLRIDLNDLPHFILTQEIVSFLAKIPQLSILNLANSQIAALPSTIASLQLYELNLQNHDMDKLPRFIGSMTSLRVLKIDSEIPFTIDFSLERLTNLTTLQMSGQSIEELPEVIQDYIQQRNADIRQRNADPKNLNKRQFLFTVDTYNNLITLQWLPRDYTGDHCLLSDTQAALSNTPLHPKDKRAKNHDLIANMCLYLSDKELDALSKTSTEANQQINEINRTNDRLDQLLMGLKNYLRSRIDQDEKLQTRYKKENLDNIGEKIRDLFITYLDEQIVQMHRLEAMMAINPDQQAIYSELANDKQFVYPTIYPKKKLNNYDEGPIPPSEYVQTQFELHLNPVAQNIFDKRLINLFRGLYSTGKSDRERADYIRDGDLSLYHILHISNTWGLTSECITKLSQIQALTFLKISSQAVLPSSISQLKQLTYLDLRNNHLKRLPESISTLNNLRDLNIKGNPELVIPKSILDMENTWIVAETHQIPLSYLGHYSVSVFDYRNFDWANIPFYCLEGVCNGAQAAYEAICYGAEVSGNYVLAAAYITGIVAYFATKFFLSSLCVVMYSVGAIDFVLAAPQFAAQLAVPVAPIFVAHAAIAAVGLGFCVYGLGQFVFNDLSDYF